MPVYACEACLYTFAANNIRSERCPDCDKQVVARRLSVDGKTPVRDYPAVPPATNTKRFRRKLRRRKPPPEKRPAADRNVKKAVPPFPAGQPFLLCALFSRQKCAYAQIS